MPPNTQILTPEQVKGLPVEDIQRLIESGAFNHTSRRPGGLRERNARVIAAETKANPTVSKFRQSLQRRFGLDIFSESKFPVNDPMFNWNKLRERLESRFAEADSETTFAQFLRAGIQMIAMNAYQSVPTTFEDWVTVVASKRAEELYAPNHGVAFPGEVGLQGKYPEVGAAALDLKIRNRKYGALYNVEWELVEDDQTGSFSRQSALLGEYLKLVTEVICMAKLSGVACKYSNLSVPATETKPSYETQYPYAYATPLRGGMKNRPSAFGALSQANIQAAITSLVNAVNLQKLKMGVQPNRLLIGPTKAFDAATLLNSSYWPSGAAASGAVGGAFAINPLQSNPFKVILDMTMSRFMADQNGVMDGSSSAWYVMDSTKPFFVAQYREPVTILQEAPNAGKSFEDDVLRFKGRTRQNADFIDPRFCFQGSDGSA